MASAPLGDATKGSPGGSGMYTGSSARSSRSSMQGSQETLYTLAADTGGKALLDNNDLGLGIVQAQKEISSYYILGYYSANDKLDGRYRRIKLQPVAELRPRSARSTTARATSPARSSASSTPPTRSASCRKRSCSATR